MSEQAETGQQAQAELWEVRDSGTTRAMHTFFALVPPEGEMKLLDVAGWRPTSAVTAVLAAAGFVPGQALSPLEVVELAAGSVAFEPIRGFRFAPERMRKVEVTLRACLAGAVGGFREVVLGAVGFHMNPMAFAMAWEAADRPPVLTCGPELEDGARGTRGIRQISDRARQVLHDLAEADDPAALAELAGSPGAP